MTLNGTVKGASNVYVNAVRKYVYSSASPVVIDSNAISTIQSNLYSTSIPYSFAQGAATLTAQLLNGLTDGNGNALSSYDALLNPTGTFHLQPGVLIENTGVVNGGVVTGGDITLSSPCGLTSWRYGSGNEPGALTLRAAGNLTINASIYDDPSGAYPTTPAPSWNINLVAGANTLSANPMAVIPYGPGATAGTLTILSGEVVYTESGSIGFASGGDTIIKNPGVAYSGPLNIYNGYNLATYSGSIQGNVDGNLTLSGGVIASATGTIDANVGGNLTLGWNSTYSLLGGILTTGVPTSNVQDYSTYANGGSISLDVGRDIDGQVILSTVWLAETSTTTGPRGHRTTTYTIFPNYADPQGILAMAGGDVSVRAGGHVEAQLGTFGAGDLAVYAGGDLEGRFLVKDGVGTLNAMGNFGMPNQVANGVLKSWAQLIEMYNAQISVTARGNVEIGAVVNPDLAYGVSASGGVYWDNTYTPGSSISLTAVTGDVNMYGSIDARYGSFYGTGTSPYLPASVEIAALAGNIDVMAGFTQLPAGPSPSSPSTRYGTLSMTAGGNIVFSNGASWLMSDADPSLIYPFGSTTAPSLTSHASILLPDGTYVPLYYGDSVPVVISAGGDITDMNITLPERSAIFAGGNITDLNFIGQNIQSADVTSIAALRNITYGTTYGSTEQANGQAIGINLSGPGYLVVQAGGRIDLGQSEGIQSLGNLLNPVLGSSGSLIVAAGLSGALEPQAVSAFFESVRREGDDYSPLLAGDPAAAQAIIDQARADIIAPFLTSHGARDGGDITMTSPRFPPPEGAASRFSRRGPST